MLTILVFILNVCVLALFPYVVIWAIQQFVAIPANILKIIKAIFVLVILIWAVEVLSSAGNGLLFNPHWR